jgi:hypothetical protein
VRIGGDSGAPVTSRIGDDVHAAPFVELAKRVEASCKAAVTAGPSVTIED